MDRGKRAAIVAALVIVLLVAAVGSYLILSSGAEEEMPEWVPTVTPYVDDRAGVLLPDDWFDIDEFCYEVEINNSCEMAVLIVNDTQPVGISDYAIKTFQKNGIGQEGKDNGVLFVFSSDERAWTVVVGDGISDILGGAKLTELSLIYLDPHLDSGEWSYGIKLFVYAMGLELVDNYQGEGHDDSSGYPVPFVPLNWWQWLLVVGVFVALSVVTRGRFLFLIFYVFSALLGRGGGGRWGGGGTGGGRIGGRF